MFMEADFCFSEQTIRQTPLLSERKLFYSFKQTTLL